MLRTFPSEAEGWANSTLESSQYMPIPVEPRPKCEFLKKSKALAKRGLFVGGFALVIGAFVDRSVIVDEMKAILKGSLSIWDTSAITTAIIASLALSMVTLSILLAANIFWRRWECWRDYN